MVPLSYFQQVPARELVMADALAEFPDVTVEYERLVPTNHHPLPYLWTNDGDFPGFGDAVSADPSVDQFTRIANFDEGALYRVERADTREGLLRWVVAMDRDISLLQAEGRGDEWYMKVRFPSREKLSVFREFTDQRDIDLRVVRLYDLTDPKLGQYNITRKQREALIRALEMGHFEVPREATLEEVAETLDISAKALSERLRRGQTNLISNSLTVGQPAGVGVGDQ